jgi:hypothetical protein
LLEKTALEFPDEPEIAAVLQAARQSRDEMEERRFVQEQLVAAAPLERAAQFSSALKVIESALERYPRSSDLGEAQSRLQHRLREAERRQRIASFRRQIEDQLHAGRFERAVLLAQAAAAEFPGEPALAEFRERALTLRRRTELDALVAQVENSLQRGEVDEGWAWPSTLQQAPETPALKDLRLRVENEKLYRSAMRAAHWAL